MKLLRDSAVVSFATMISRILGLIRDQLFAFVLGASLSADAFLAAFRLPNLFRHLFAEGLFPAAFVPLFSARLTSEGPEKARDLAGEIWAVLSLVLLLATLLAEIFMPQLMQLLAGGLLRHPALFEEAVLYARITFPYLPCMALLALYAGILNASGRFAAAAAAPILLNITLILSLLIAREAGAGGFLLSCGVIFAGLLQTAMLAIACRRATLSPTLLSPRLTKNTSQFARLATPALATGAAAQMMILIATRIASDEAGGIAALYYAERLYQLPLALIGIAISIALLPDLSSKWQEGQKSLAAESFARATRFAMLLALPATAALLVLAFPILRTLFEYGAFTEEDTHRSAAALSFFALGLPAFVLIRILQVSFFAQQDTKTPSREALIALLLYIPVALLLFDALGLSGLALATALVAWIQLARLLFCMRGTPLLTSFLAEAPRFLRILAASALLGVMLYALRPLYEPLMIPRDTLLVAFSMRIFTLGSLVLFGVFFYAFLGRIFGATLPGEIAESLALAKSNNASRKDKAS